MGTEVHAPASQSGVLLRAPRWRVLNDKSFQVLLPLCVRFCVYSSYIPYGIPQLIMKPFVNVSNQNDIISQVFCL